MITVLNLLRDLRSYYRGSRGRDQREFYDLESSLPYFDNVNRILGRHKRRVILELLEPPRSAGDPLLEIGCGVGTMARVLAARGERVIGIDISPRKIGRARSWAGTPGAGGAAERGRIDYHVGDLCQLGEGGPLDQALCEGKPLEFSRILAADVLEHVPSPPVETAKKLRSLLCPGGQLVASVPSRLCVRDPGHLWRLPPEEWEKFFVSAGLEVRVQRVSRIFWYRLWTPLPLAMVFDLRRA